jgi:hypothetical protein
MIKAKVSGNAGGTQTGEYDYSKGLWRWFVENDG